MGALNYRYYYFLELMSRYAPASLFEPSVLFFGVTGMQHIR